MTLMVASPTRGKKRARHLRFIRSLPCCICGMVPSEAAHVRLNAAETGKLQALGQKPDDMWSVPLCAAHHREDNEAQHRIGERAFWAKHRIDPLALARLLFEATGTPELGEKISRQARRLAAQTNG